MVKKAKESADARRPAVGYLRVSTEEQAFEGISIAAQRAKIESYCDLHGLELVAVQSDEGISGKRSENRPGLQKALTVAVKRKAALVTYSLSRLSRSTRDAIDIAERLDRAGADLVSLSERIDSTTAMGRYFFTTVAALAQLERDQVAERTRMALAHKRSRGERISGLPPYGYDFSEDGRRLLVNRYEQSVIKRVVRLRTKGMSLRSIAQQLNKDGVDAKLGNTWYPEAVRRILLRT